jgi:CRP-like cAMP-binding protein
MSASEEKTVTCAIFQGLSPAEQKRVLELTQREAFPEGHVIIHEGKSIQMLWIIARGTCEVQKSTRNGAAQRLAVLESGAVFGEMSFFHAAPHSATVRAVSDVETLRLTREAFEKLEKTCPSAAGKIAVNIVSVLAERLRKMDEWICDLTERPDADKHREEWQDFRSKLYTDWQF